MIGCVCVGGSAGLVLGLGVLVVGGRGALELLVSRLAVLVGRVRVVRDARVDDDRRLRRRRRHLQLLRRPLPRRPPLRPLTNSRRRRLGARRPLRPRPPRWPPLRSPRHCSPGPRPRPSQVHRKEWRRPVAEAAAQASTPLLRAAAAQVRSVSFVFLAFWLPSFVSLSWRLCFSRVNAIR